MTGHPAFPILTASYLAAPPIQEPLEFFKSKAPSPCSLPLDFPGRFGGGGSHGAPSGNPHFVNLTELLQIPGFPGSVLLPLKSVSP